MRAALRYVIQFLAGVGLFAVSSRTYFLVWEYYARKLPRPYQAYEFIENRATMVMVVLFIIYQLLAYAGVRALLRSP